MLSSPRDGRHREEPDDSVAKGKLTEAEKEAITGRIKPTTELAPAKECDLVIEAIIENKQAKLDLFRELEGLCPAQVIFASNTSSIPITEMATATKRPDKFAGMHFFSPVPVMKLVEIIRGLKTSDATIQVIKDLVDRIGKVGVSVKDGPGFLVNRVNAALRNEVYNCLAEGVATIEDIDKALKFGLGHPMGPFELGDFVGLEIGYAVAETLWENFKDPKWRPSLLLKKLVTSGDLGRKTGKGGTTTRAARRSRGPTSIFNGFGKKRHTGESRYPVVVPGSDFVIPCLTRNPGAANDSGPRPSPG